MIYVLTGVIVLLVVAVIVLFAMFGELYARVAPEGVQGNGQLRLVPSAKIGALPDRWPGALDELAAADRVLLFVFSSTCSSCDSAAEDLAARPDRFADFRIGIIVSTPTFERGAEFLANHSALRHPSYVDAGGGWSTAELGITTSPTAVVFRYGQLTSALGFTDLATLREASALRESEAAT